MAASGSNGTAVPTGGLKEECPDIMSVFRVLQNEGFGISMSQLEKAMIVLGRNASVNNLVDRCYADMGESPEMATEARRTSADPKLGIRKARSGVGRTSAGVKKSAWALSMLMHMGYSREKAVRAMKQNPAASMSVLIDAIAAAEFDGN